MEKLYFQQVHAGGDISNKNNFHIIFTTYMFPSSKRKRKGVGNGMGKARTWAQMDLQYCGINAKKKKKKTKLPQRGLLPIRHNRAKNGFSSSNNFLLRFQQNYGNPQGHYDNHNFLGKQQRAFTHPFGLQEKFLMLWRIVLTRSVL